MGTSFVEDLLRKVKPTYMVVIIGIAGAGVTLWLDIRHTEAVDILVVALLFLVLALIFEQWRGIALAQILQ